MKSLHALALVLLTSFGATAGSSAAEPTTQLLAEAQAAYLRGDLEVAKAKFQLVNSLDPKNPTAIGYLRTIQANERKGNGSQEKELARLIVPSVQFREASLTSALDFLKQTVNKITEGKQAVNFVVQVPDEQAKSVVVTLNLTNVPFTEVLKYLGTLANVSFVYDRYAITVRPLGPTAATPVTNPPAQTQ